MTEPAAAVAAEAPPLAVLVHGMGRTPLSMLPLALRLRRAGLRTANFAYSPTFERLAPCLARLERFIARRLAGAPYVVIGHSLGNVLLRAVLPRLAYPPAAFFLLAPPSCACTLARRVAPWLPYRLLTGQMGQALADPQFMAALPPPPAPAVVFAGTAGPRRAWLPLGKEENDGILQVAETAIAGVPLVRVDALHTYFMHSPPVMREVVARALAALPAGGPAAAWPATRPTTGGNMHSSRLAGFIVDCQTQDLHGAARFWAGALGMQVQELPGAEGQTYARLIGRNEALHIEVQTVSHPSRVHLDIETDDIEAEVRRLEALGARRVAAVKSWWVMEAPTGHRFCVVSADGSPGFASGATRWP